MSADGPALPRRLGPFVLGDSPGDLLGEGSTARVLLARHQSTRAEVALKVWHGDPDRSVRARFARECRIHWAMSSHPGVVRMHTASRTDEDVLWIAEEAFEEALDDRMRRAGPLSVAEAHRVALALLDAVDGCHARGFVHRDIKPANILLSGERVALADFGSADHLARPGEDQAEGTPPYVAPELLAGGVPGAVTDLFSVGRTLQGLAACCRGQALGTDVEPAPESCLESALESATDPSPRSRGTTAQLRAAFERSFAERSFAERCPRRV